MEKVTQASPTETADLTDWFVEVLYMNWPKSIIHVDVISNTGIQRNKEYTGTDAIGKMIALNKANLSSNSLHKRILGYLVADGVIEGTITGSPD